MRLSSLDYLALANLFVHSNFVTTYKQNEAVQLDSLILFGPLQTQVWNYLPNENQTDLFLVTNSRTTYQIRMRSLDSQSVCPVTNLSRNYIPNENEAVQQDSLCLSVTNLSRNYIPNENEAVKP